MTAKVHGEITLPAVGFLNSDEALVESHAICRQAGLHTQNQIQLLCGQSTNAGPVGLVPFVNVTLSHWNCQIYSTPTFCTGFRLCHRRSKGRPQLSQLAINWEEVINSKQGGKLS